MAANPAAQLGINAQLLLASSSAGHGRPAFPPRCSTELTAPQPRALPRPDKQQRRWNSKAGPLLAHTRNMLAGPRFARMRALIR